MFKKKLYSFWRQFILLFKKPASFKYDPYGADEDRLAAWRGLLEGKSVDSLIVHEKKSVFGVNGIKESHPGVVGLIIGGVPVYIRPGAFGDAFGTLEVFMGDEGKFIFAPEKTDV